MIEFGFYNVWIVFFECKYDTMKIILHTRDQPNTMGEEKNRGIEQGDSLRALDFYDYTILKAAAKTHFLGGVVCK